MCRKIGMMLLAVMTGLSIQVFAPGQSASAADPVNANASTEAAILLDYIEDISGSQTLIGQHSYPGYYNEFFNEAHTITGEYPAIWNTDLGFTNGGADTMTNRGAIVDEAIAKWYSGNIVSLTWHMCSPTLSGSSCLWNPGVQGIHLTSQQWTDITTPGTSLYNAFIARIDEAYPYLQELEDAHVPVLWRPFHEMNGTWFWWGGDPVNSLKLYRIMYDRYVNVHHLNNLIWMWNVNRPSDGSNLYDYYPGEDYVDILTMDTYEEDYATSYYDTLLDIADGKPIGLGEVGQVPTSAVLNAQPQWAFAVVWAQFLTETQFNTETEIQAFYDLSRTLSRDQVNLPLAADTQAPTTPTNLSSPFDTGYWIDLTWSASSDNLAVYGYDVYVNGAYQGFSKDTSYTIEGLTPSTTYSIQVKAKDWALNSSSASSAIQVTTDPADTTPPTAPGSLSSPAKTGNTVDLAWTASTDNVLVTGYEINVDGVFHHSTTATSTTVNGLVPGQAYSFSVIAQDIADNASSPSQIAVTTETTITDELQDLSIMYAHSANVSIDSTNAPNFDGDTRRLMRTALSSESVTYRTMNDMTSFKVEAYFWPNESPSHFSFSTSADNSSYSALTPTITDLGGNWKKIEYTSSSLPSGTHYLKIGFTNNTTSYWAQQISRVTIEQSGSGGGGTPSGSNRYEAEDADLHNVYSASTKSGYSGSGYIYSGSFDQPGDTITFHVNASAAGSYPLTIGYAASQDKDNYVVVNGSQSTVTFPSTGNAWSSLQVGNVTLNAGSNTIVLKKYEGWIYVDYIEVGSPPPASIYEAEDADLNNVYSASTKSGYSGSGYIYSGSFDQPGDTITFQVNASAADTYALSIRYAASQDKDNYVIVNGSQSTVTFPSTGNAWTTLNVGNVTLNAGSNTIVLKKYEGWIYVDYLKVELASP